jgi:hypothetical protein
MALIDDDKLHRIIEEVEYEFRSASSKNGAFNSAHEGWAVLYEEVEELWDEVKKKRKVRNLENMKLECVQIAAMAIRFAHDLL